MIRISIPHPGSLSRITVLGLGCLFFVGVSFANPVFGNEISIQEVAADKAKTGVSGDTENKEFASPEILIAFSDAVNGDGKRLVYPASAIFDVDGDGADELVVGTINGYFTKFENTNKEDSDGSKPSWGEPEFLKTSAGKRIKLDNC